MKAKLLVLGLTMVGVVLFGQTRFASASSLTLDLGHVFSGYIPPGTAPYISVTIADISTDKVQITFTTDPAGAGVLTGSAFISNWYLNSNNTNLTSSSFSLVSGDAATVSVQFTNSPPPGSQTGYKADGDGYHDIWFAWPSGSAGRFSAGETVIYTATAVGLTALDFAALGTNSSNGQYFSAAHIQGFNSCSGWVGAADDGIAGTPNGTAGGSSSTCNSTKVPEPSTWILLGTGLLVVGGIVRRLRREQ